MAIIKRSKTMDAGVDAGRKKYLHAVGGTVNQYNLYRKQYGDFSKK